MTQKSEVGKAGEDLACEFLKRKGWRILRRNFRKIWGEIDIVAQARDLTLVFAEVKTLMGTYPESDESRERLVPEDMMTSQKRGRLNKICQGFANKNPKLINERAGWRIDLLAITIYPPLEEAVEEKRYKISHYENA